MWKVGIRHPRSGITGYYHIHANNNDEAKNKGAAFFWQEYSQKIYDYFFATDEKTSAKYGIQGMEIVKTIKNLEFIDCHYVGYFTYQTLPLLPDGYINKEHSNLKYIFKNV